VATTNDLRVIRASAHDTEVIAPLFDAYRQFYDQLPDLEGARSFIRQRLERDESVVFLAVREAGSEAATLGFVQLYPAFSSVSICRVWILNDLYVVPDARGCGVGRALMAAAHAHAKQTGARRVLLSTAQRNARARALYDALGYVRDDQFVSYSLDIRD
jgi:ribosomal protein S18 acetylase RimI-like enzyme